MLKHRPQKKSDLGNLQNCHGHDLLHLFHSFVKGLDKNDLRDDLKGRYTTVSEVVAVGRCVMVKLEFGRFGEAGNTYNVHSHGVSHARTAQDAPTEMSRLLFVVPPGAESALFAIEAVSGATGGPVLVDAFKAALVKRWDQDYWPLDRVYERDSWLQLVSLKSLTAVYYKWKRDLQVSTQPTRMVYGRMERTLFPETAGGSLPNVLLESIRSNQLKASTVMGFEEDVDGVDQEPDAIMARVSDGEREKTVELGKEGVPTVRIVFTDSGTPPLDNVAFRKRCIDEAQELYEGITGNSIPDGLLTGKWDQEDLDRKW